MMKILSNIIFISLAIILVQLLGEGWLLLLFIGSVIWLIKKVKKS